MFARLTQIPANPKSTAPITSQRFDDTKATSPACTFSVSVDHRIDLGPRLVEAQRVDRQHGVEQCLRAWRRQRRPTACAASRSTGWRFARRGFSARRGRARIREGVELEIGVEQTRPDRAGDARESARAHNRARARSASRNPRSGRQASASRNIRAAWCATIPTDGRHRARRPRGGARSRHARRTACHRRRRRKRAGCTAQLLLLMTGGIVFRSFTLRPRMS